MLTSCTHLSLFNMALQVAMLSIHTYNLQYIVNWLQTQFNSNRTLNLTVFFNDRSISTQCKFLQLSVEQSQLSSNHESFSDLPLLFLYLHNLYTKHTHTQSTHTPKPHNNQLYCTTQTPEHPQCLPACPVCCGSWPCRFQPKLLFDRAKRSRSPLVDAM